MTTTTINRDLFVDVLAHIESDPNSWHQGSWASASCGVPAQGAKIDPLAPPCGTAFCMAGWACVVSGERINWGTNPDFLYDPENWSGNGDSIETRARELLTNGGYTGGLFGASNSLDVLYRISARIIDGLDADGDNGDGDEAQLRADVQKRVVKLRKLQAKRLVKVRQKAEEFEAKAAAAQAEAARLGELVSA